MGSFLLSICEIFVPLLWQGLCFILFSTPLQMSCLKIWVSLLLLEKDNKKLKDFQFQLKFQEEERSDGNLLFTVTLLLYINMYD